ncbi:TetR/AcrR family transcriptional regulator [Mycobacterium sp. NAZ190054]|uniref:TetR/AcrR family transcriptional regulator n=1 Tax=Mycobacterium sp. NAZ190054 TaxID=1747766 RepID=UPI00079119C1|nr:TetR/AcrR family transcriptional regulator [Mycobacterium sp. NAZ190054]KWX66101.1 TetR family transcriptional regulator [Mycobacterium sp. NAZ190054]
MPGATGTTAISGYEARWQQHNVERRTQILQAAIELIEESPSDAGFSVQSIAKRAGLAKSVVYRQFSSKDELERRVRSYLVSDFAAVLDAKLDITTGSLREILSRTVESVVDWMLDHPRLHEFARRGPTFEGDGSLDAVSELKQRMTRRAEGIIAAIAGSIGVDDAAFKTVPFAVVTMVEATLFAWVRGVAPTRSREEMVADLADYAWYVLDGASRSIGLEVSRDEPLMAVVAALTGK